MRKYPLSTILERLNRNTTMESAEANIKLHIRSGIEQLAAWVMASPEYQENPDNNPQSVVDQLRELMCFYRCAISEVETKLNVLDTHFSLQHDRNPISSITSRLKTPESIYEKVHRADIEPGIRSLRQNMHDIAGIRVVCSFVEDVYMLADCLERQDDIVILRRKDYIENPKPNGYRSLHLIIEVPVYLPESTQRMQVEVQLRTIAMQFWASLEHNMRYKKHMEPELQKATEDALWQCAELSSELDYKMQNVRHMIDGFHFLSDMEDGK